MPKLYKTLTLLLLCLAWISQVVLSQPGAPDPDFLPNQQTAIDDFAYNTVLEVFPDGNLLLARSRKVVIINRQQEIIWSTPAGKYFNIQVAKRLTDGKVVAAGYFHRGAMGMGYGVLRFLANGTQDTTFENPVIETDNLFTYGGNFEQLIIQPDGKILLLGGLTKLAGVEGKKSICRLLSNGALDPDFQLLQFSESQQRGVLMAGIMADGKILLSHLWKKCNGIPVPQLIRLLPNGSLDTSFQNQSWTQPITSLQPWINGGWMVASQSGNTFTMKALKPDGTLENSFVGPSLSPFSISGYVRKRDFCQVYPDGKLLVCGVKPGDSLANFHRYSPQGAWLGSLFSAQSAEELYLYNSFHILEEGKVLFAIGYTSIQKKARNGFVLLDANGQILNDYVKLMKRLYQVTSTIVAPDQKILVGGEFTQALGKERFGIVRLHPDGALDSSFVPPFRPDNWFVAKMDIQSDGKILVLWAKLFYYGFGFGYGYSFQRLHQNGLVDSSFFLGGTPLSFSVHGFHLQTDGKIVLAEYQNSKQQIRRILPNGTADPDFFTFVDQQYKLGTIVNFDPLPNGKLMVNSWRLGFEGPPSKTGTFRILSNGKYDSSFVDVAGEAGIWSVHGISAMEGGKMLLFGRFNTYQQKPRKGVVVLQEDGTVDDLVFDVSPLNAWLGPTVLISCSKALRQLDGKWIFYLDGMYGVIARFNPDGSFDPTFVPYISKAGYLSGFRSSQFMAFQHNQERLLAGFYDENANQTETNYARLFLGEQQMPGLTTVKGQIWRGEKNTCQLADKTAQQEQFLLAQPLRQYSSSNEEGKYQFKLPSGDVEIQQIPNPAIAGGARKKQVCPGENQGYRISVSQGQDTASLPDFVNQIPDCPRLQVWVQSSPKRPCALGNTVLQVSNDGNKDSDANTLVSLNLPKSIFLLKSEVPFQFSSLDSSYRFQFGSVPAFSRKSFSIVDSMDCMPVLPKNQLLNKAWMTGNAGCQPAGNEWDGVDLQVKNRCRGGQVTFIIHNTGQSMGQALTYRIFADTLLAWEKSFLLKGGDSLLLRLPQPKGGVRYRLEIPQTEGNPLSHFAFTEATCHPSRELAGRFSPHNGQPFVHQSSIVTDSLPAILLDAAPRGVGSAGFILPNRPLEYRLHFQNQSSDTARNVVARVYLDSDLDLGSFQAGPSSHAFRLSLAGRGRPYLDFALQQSLPPKNLGHNPGGFVSFRIWPRQNLAAGTRIELQADVFFDQKGPLRSASILHTLWNPALTEGLIDTVLHDDLSETEFIIYPNPSPGSSVLETRNVLDFQMCSISGQLLTEGHLEAGKHHLALQHLPVGMYFLRLRWLGGSRVVKLIRE